MRARISLQTAVSLGRAGGKVYVRGKPVVTSDRAEIAWAEANPAFSVTYLSTPRKRKVKQPDEARVPKKAPAPPPPPFPPEPPEPKPEPEAPPPRPSKPRSAPRSKSKAQTKPKTKAPAEGGKE